MLTSAPALSLSSKEVITPLTLPGQSYRDPGARLAADTNDCLPVKAHDPWLRGLEEAYRPMATNHIETCFPTQAFKIMRLMDYPLKLLPNYQKAYKYNILSD